VRQTHFCNGYAKELTRCFYCILFLKIKKIAPQDFFLFSKRINWVQKKPDYRKWYGLKRDEFAQT